MGSAERGTIYLEEGEILNQQAFAGNQFILRVRAPIAARHAQPGSFAHITCDASVPLRRPLSIMRAHGEEGWLEFLYKPLGAGLAHLARRSPGESLSLLAPIGRGFEPVAARPRLLAIGGGVGIPPMIFLAERLKDQPTFRPLVLMGSEVPFPFELQIPRLEVPGAPAGASRAVALLESWGVPSRLASNASLAGAYPGFVTELAREWLASLPQATRDEVQVLACGPEAMLRAATEVANAFDLPCQLALEEFMACGTGGCAGCTVLIHTVQGAAMKRVCVDGPVFDAREVFPRPALS